MSDFLVIGGGIAGVSAAARLARLGKVTLLEREGQLGYHASGRSAAIFESSYGPQGTLALNAESYAHHAEANGGVLSPRGLLSVALPGEEDAFAADCQTLKMQEISLSDAQKMIPILRTDRLIKAAHHAEAWDIDTDRLIQNFARDVTRHGGQIQGQSDVVKIDRTRLGWTVRTGRGDIHGAQVLVNAAGAWADEIALMARIRPLGLVPKRRSMGRIPAPDGQDVSDWPLLFGPGESWYAKPDAGALIVSPADADPAEPHDAFADDLVLAEGFARYEAHVTAPVARLLASWAGLRTFSPDGDLVLGPDPEAPGFIWCAGQGGYGFQTAPAASKLIAELIAGQAPTIGADIAAALSPARFR